jgi:hypothetical protein
MAQRSILSAVARQLVAFSRSPTAQGCVDTEFEGLSGVPHLKPGQSSTAPGGQKDEANGP